jgi:hypothetical protein
VYEIYWCNGILKYNIPIFGFKIGRVFMITCNVSSTTVNKMPLLSAT